MERTVEARPGRVTVGHGEARGLSPGGDLSWSGRHPDARRLQAPSQVRARAGIRNGARASAVPAAAFSAQLSPVLETPPAQVSRKGTEAAWAAKGEHSLSPCR